MKQDNASMSLVAYLRFDRGLSYSTLQLESHVKALKVTLVLLIFFHCYNFSLPQASAEYRSISA